MPYYHKRPITVEARQFTGDNFPEPQYWGNDFVTLSDYNKDTFCVHTLEGPVWGEKGDYIVKGVRVGDKKHRIPALNTLVATGEVEIECEEVD